MITAARSNLVAAVAMSFSLFVTTAHAQSSSEASAIATSDPVVNAETTAKPAKIDCVEVKLFQVSDDKVKGQTERAETIPAANLAIIQAGVVKHLPKAARGVVAIAAGGSACPNPSSSAVLGGDILDFRKGNKALRYLVGFGAGAQKVRVRLTLTRTDGTPLSQIEIADTKWGGAFGGSASKGLDDFAEKAAQAAGSALKSL